MATTDFGPLRWMAPENFQHIYSNKSGLQLSAFTESEDVWSYAILLVELVTGQLPYPHVIRASEIAFRVLQYVF